MKYPEYCDFGIEENHVRHYLYDKNSGKHGLIFKPRISNGSFIVRNDARVPSIAHRNVDAMIERTTIEFDTLSDLPTTYVKQELKQLLLGEPSEWLILAVTPVPNCVLLKLSHPVLMQNLEEWPDELLVGRDRDAMNELCKHSHIIVGIGGGDIAHPEGPETKIRFQCKQNGGIHFTNTLTVHAEHDANWQGDYAFVTLEANEGYKCEYMLYWESEGTDIVAQIHVSP